MCGICGYSGHRDAAPILLNAIKKLEYRGYDSAGIATVFNKKIEVKKDIGKISEINERINLDGLLGTVGIAHTRWATHGGRTKENAHPHSDCKNEITVVHNGIINNYQELRDELLADGHEFRSHTDTEVVPHIIESYTNQGLPFDRAFRKTVNKLEGSFALVALSVLEKDLYAARIDAPLVIGVGRNENFIASDVLSFIEHTDQTIFINNRQIASVHENSIKITDFDGRPVTYKIDKVAWEAADVSKEGFDHYTLKEIHEQPKTVRNALMQDTEVLAKFVNDVREADKVYLTGSGTSFNAALFGEHLLAKSGISTKVVLASKFDEDFDTHYEGKGNSVIVALSQSGETADLLGAVKQAKERKAKILSIVNAMGSSLARESDVVMYLNCGPEIGVAATKSFTSQLQTLNLLYSKLNNEKIDGQIMSEYVNEVISNEDTIKEVSKLYHQAPDFYFVGRGLHHPIALEGALKLKELTYTHAEGMEAGELKHGTLALISEGTPAVVINPEDKYYKSTLGNAQEMKSRGAKIIGVSTKSNEIYDSFIRIPRVENHLLYPILEVIPLQMLAYYTSVERKNNPDYPRNLAKSVTVK